MLRKKKFCLYLIFLFVNLFLVGCTSWEREKVEAQIIHLKSIGDIRPIKDSLVIPYLYSNPISLETLPIEEKKKKFVDMILPAILIAKHNLDQDAMLLKDLEKRSKKTWNSKDSLHLSYFNEKYGTDHLVELEIRVKTHPVSIVLAQAAMESGWGTSDFYLKANNVFGIWANENTPEKIEANASRNGKPIYLRKYATVSASIEDYYLVLSKVRAYRKFRNKRSETNDPYAMLPFLKNYSELGKVYTRKIRRIIKENNLTKYDTYHIDRKYIGKNILY